MYQALSGAYGATFPSDEGKDYIEKIPSRFK